MQSLNRNADAVRGQRSARKGLNLLAALSLLLPALVGAQTGPTPAYIASIPEFEVRRLDGAYAPSDGNLTMEDITPSEWLNNDPSVLGLNGVLAAWSGGAKSIGTKMFVHGGGHFDSANNGMYTFDFSGGATPTGWQTPLVISDVSAVRDQVMTYTDGRPNSVHTYDGIVFASHNNFVYRFGGSRYSSGNLTNASFKYNVANGDWTQVPNYPGAQSAAKTVYDPVTGKIFVTMTGVFQGYFYRTSDDSWSGRKSYGGNGFPFDSMAAWDSRRNRAIIVGEGEASIVNIDFANETISVESFSPAGDTSMIGRSGISAAYDPVRDVYWLFGGPAGSPGWSNIYEMSANGNPWTIRRIPLTGASIPTSRGMIGSWGRFVLMPQWGAIGLVASETSPALIIRLPDGSTTTPESPGNMLAQ